MSAEKQQYFSLKTQFNIDLSINENWKLKLMNMFGSDRQAHKNPIINSEDISDLDHTKSQHTRSLQKSDYVQIEHRKDAIANDLKFIIESAKEEQIQSGIKVENKTGQGEKLFKNLPLIVRYCKHEEVQ